MSGYGFGYWIAALVAESGHPVQAAVPKDTRILFRRLAKFLLVNDFDHVSQLVDEAGPQSWKGAGFSLLRSFEELLLGCACACCVRRFQKS